MSIALPSQIVSNLELKAGHDTVLDVKDSKIIIRKKMKMLKN